MAETVPLFLEDHYLADCPATVTGVGEDGAISLDRTVFYATSGGQPGDTGRIIVDGRSIAIGATVYAAGKAHLLHLPAGDATPPAPGSAVRAEIDWDRRYRHMRMHTALHLLCALVPYPVTGGSIGAEDSRLDFDIADAGAIDREALTQRLNELIVADHPVTTRWISAAELAASPGLVRTMSVKPPTDSGRVRLVAIGADSGIDLQPCGGTHVRSTGEIGPMVLTRIEKKGRQNRRVRLAFDTA